MKSVFTLCLTFLIAYTAFSQTKKNTLSIKQEFDKIYRISTSYQEYKVISKLKYQNLKTKVLDSIIDLKQEIKQKNSLVKVQTDSLADSKKVIAILSGDLNQTITEKNSITLLGISMSKTAYNLLVWVIIALLLFSLLFFIYKFKKSNILTTEAKDNLQELEEEFATHKKKSLEKEQKLRRQLQDEINKQRGV
jgi:hypothetical protein